MCGVQYKESLNAMLPEASQEADHSSSSPKLKQQNEEACLCKHFPQDNRATDMIWYIFWQKEKIFSIIIQILSIIISVTELRS